MSDHARTRACLPVCPILFPPNDQSSFISPFLPPINTARHGTVSLRRIDGLFPHLDSCLLDFVFGSVWGLGFRSRGFLLATVLTLLAYDMIYIPQRTLIFFTWIGVRCLVLGTRRIRHGRWWMIDEREGKGREGTRTVGECVRCKAPSLQTGLSLYTRLVLYRLVFFTKSDWLRSH